MSPVDSAAAQRKIALTRLVLALAVGALVATLLTFAWSGDASPGDALPGSASGDIAAEAARSDASIRAHDVALRLRPPLEIDPLAPASAGGLRSLDRALARLATHRRMLMIAAHPDDEDTALLARVARGEGGEAAYLSLSRGDGGQNLIGPETGISLGLLRSRELEAARRVDGARQYFARAYDFGFTRSLEETLRRWPREVLLEDTARVVRRFAPQVIVSVFPPTPQAGHGHHQAAAVIADDVVRIARQPDDAFPELTAAGWGPWRVDALYRSAWFSPEAADVSVDLGVIEPFTGRSLLQIALASRSQHRCQDMGQVQYPGEARGRYTRVVVPPGAEAIDDDIFAGIDTSLPALSESIADPELRSAVALELAAVERLAIDARATLAPSAVGRVVEPLAEIVRRLDAALRRLEAGGEPGRTQAWRLIDEKRQIASEALATAAKVVVDATVAGAGNGESGDVDGAITPGESVTVRTDVWIAGDRTPEALELRFVGDGWRQLSQEPATERRRRFDTQVDDARHTRLVVERPPSLPYFLAEPLGSDPRSPDLFSWRGVPESVRGLPFGAPSLELVARLRVADAPIELRREVVVRRRDQALGEVRRPLRVVPPIELRLEPELVVWPADRRETRYVTTVRSNAPYPVCGELEVEVPEGFGAIASREASRHCLEPGAVVSIPLRLERRRAASPGRLNDETLDQLEVAFRVEDDLLSTAYPIIDYEHVRPVPSAVAARSQIQAVDLELPRLERVGWVRGASDDLPERLRAVGLPIEVIDVAALESADLDAFEVIVVGSRAYEVQPALVVANERLLDFARRGGLLLLLYQQYQFANGGFAPDAFTIARPHDRVTDETARIRALVPEHPIFRRPNPIGPADWRGWVQERGLYFAHTWGETFTPLLAAADAGDEPKRGGLLVAPLGEGHYLYTGLAFHRQIPAGVPGAYRLFANLLALGERGESSLPD
ncbi:MAG: PIG-L family deacetylase [Acidobacteriota bacterium]